MEYEHELLRCAVYEESLRDCYRTDNNNNNNKETGYFKLLLL